MYCWARSFQGQHGLGVFIAIGFLFSMADRFGHSFSGYVEQAGPNWLNICLFGLYLKQ